MGLGNITSQDQPTGMNFINNRIVQIPSSFVVAYQVRLSVTMILCVPWMQGTLTSGSFSCLLPGVPPSVVIFVLWAFAMHCGLSRFLAASDGNPTSKCNPKRDFVRRLVRWLKGCSLTLGRTRMARSSLYVCFLTLHPSGSILLISICQHCSLKPTSSISQEMTTGVFNALNSTV